MTREMKGYINVNLKEKYPNPNFPRRYNIDEYSRHDDMDYAGLREYAEISLPNGDKYQVWYWHHHWCNFKPL